jgi:hypothetical protein
MKYIITEDQNNRILKLIKQFAESYSGGQIIKTEVEVEYDPERDLYLLHPIFYVKNKKGFPHHIYKHMLAQNVEDMIGVPVHTAAARVKEIEN